ncbi:GNAT family N-acetyltransferase [Lentisphaerota bacterium WC36G]|nr:GNAT family N-acetyltransferase [Lentisphaerae bacterium WC36]
MPKKFLKLYNFNMNELTKNFQLISIIKFKQAKLKEFDCGRNDLNQFLTEEALTFQAELLGSTQLGIDKNSSKIIFYYTLENDRISKKNLSYHVSSSQWKKFQHISPITNFPALKIGRLAVAKEFQNQNIGSEVLTHIKNLAINSNSLGGCRFLTVDSDPRLEVVKFYQQNDFALLISATKVAEFIAKNKKVPLFLDLKNL